MKKERFLIKEGMIKIITVIIVFLIAVILISSSSISITLTEISKTNNLIFKEVDEKISNGLAPRNRDNIKPETIKSHNIKPLFIKPADIMYGYVAYDPSGQLQEGPIKFPLEDPGTIEQIASTESNDFLSGGTGVIGLPRWLGCENGSGKIWEIDPETGDMELIGGGDVSLNGLAWNPIDNRLYGASGSKLYKIDIETGEQDFIGSFGSGVNEMIGIAFNLDGTCYGWDLGQDKLWTIDIETGEATEIGSLGIDLNYAQDGSFDWSEGILYLTAYTTTGQLYVCDLETAECELLGNFQGGAQITCSMFDPGFCCEHDIALKSIDYPETGPAGPDMKTQITVRNIGNNTETFDAQMEITKDQSVSILMEENFSGNFPPEGWETDSWVKCNSSCGPDPPCACLYNNNQGEYYSAYITSKAVNASEYKKCVLRFYFGGILRYRYCSFHVKIRLNETGAWKDITPWENPLFGDMEGQFYEITIINSSAGCGDALQIKWELFGYSYYYNYFWLDTITIEACESYYEYAELVEDITLDPGEKVKIDFPTWTPSHWQDPEYENTWVDYLVHAFVICEGDQRSGNDNKYKWIDLYFGYFHDVGCNDIINPESGPAQTFPVTGNIKNFGQYDVCCFKTYVEIAEIDNENQVKLLTENFSDFTFPPSDWKKTHDNWMYNFSDFAGGVCGEARFFNCPLSTGIIRLYTPALDTSKYDAIEIEFKHYIDHNTSPYILQLETSADGINWDVIWSISPIGNYGPEKKIILTRENVGSNTYVAWTFSGYSKKINNWYVDDIKIKGHTLLDPEYTDNLCISSIKPGEEQELSFNKWTPEFLLEEKTDTKKYLVKAWTELEEPKDQNPDNDIFNKYIILDFFHDVGIKYISSPSTPCIAYLKSKALPMPEIYVALGTEDIDVIVENNGTFPELNLTCYAEIWEFITNENGSKVYEDEITNIDLEEPIGGTKLLNFDDYTFPEEGVYGLYVDLPLEIDDYPKNNKEELIIGADGTPPITWHILDPPEPNGKNGWYRDIEITICAEDPEIAPGIPGSGVKDIRFSINDGAEQTYPGDCISLTLIEDGEEIKITYWAVDNVGNYAPKKYFTINLDSTTPEIAAQWETYRKSGSWYVKFTCTAADAMSGMDRVEMYINDELFEINNGSGPVYEFVIEWSAEVKTSMYKFVAYDKAGNSDFDEIAGSNIKSHFRVHTSNYHILFNLLLLRLREKFQILHRLLGIFEGF